MNLQHDCHLGKCEASGIQHLQQEREVTSRSRAVIRHSDSTHFIVNTQSFHNYRQIQEATPANLRNYSHRISDQRNLRAAAAAQIRNKAETALASEDVIAADGNVEDEGSVLSTTDSRSPFDRLADAIFKPTASRRRQIANKVPDTL